jgi:hypothetical protein
MKSAHLLVLGILTCGIIALSAAYYSEARQVRDLRNQLDSLRLQLTEKTHAVHVARNLKDSPLSVGTAPSTVQQTDQLSVTANNRSEHKHGPQPQEDVQKFRAEISATHKLDALEAVLTLSPDEKSRLEEQLKAFFAEEDGQAASGDQDSAARLKDVLAGVLGEERANLFIQIQNDREIKAQNENIALASTMFAQHLSLSQEQATQLSGILRGIDAQLGTPSQMIEQKLQELHSKGEDITQSPAQALKQYSNISSELREQRRSLLNAQLKTVLTPAQYNNLLSEEANAEDWLWGLRGY